MTLASLAAFAGAICVLFFTPGPGNVAMVARTLDAGPVHGFVYGAGILAGDIVWLTVAVFGLTTATELAQTQPALLLAARLTGACVLAWFAWSAFRRFLSPGPPSIETQTPSRRALIATWAAGVAMPMTNPKPIVFYLSFLPAFFDLSAVGPASYVMMITIMGVMFLLSASAHVLLAHRARAWMAARGVKRWADLVTAAVMSGVAALLLTR